MSEFSIPQGGRYGSYKSSSPPGFTPHSSGRSPPFNPHYVERGNDEEDGADQNANNLKDFFHPNHRKHHVVITLLLVTCFASIAVMIYFIIAGDLRTAKYVSPPDITYCPTDLTRSSPLEGPTSVPVWWVEPSVANPKDENIAYHASHQPGDLFEIGNTTVTYNFTGDGGLMSVCEFDVSVIVIDGTPPVVTNCPENLSHKAPDDDNKLKVDWTEPTAESSRHVSTIKPDPTQSPGSYFSIGTTAINYVFIDSIGLFSTCSFSISVVDVTPPAIHQCPNEDIEFYVGSENALKSVLWIEPTATDNSGQVSLVGQTHRPGDFFPVGSTVVQYMYEDPTGNINMCSFFVKGKVSKSSNASRAQTLNYFLNTLQHAPDNILHVLITRSSKRINSVLMMGLSPASLYDFLKLFILFHLFMAPEMGGSRFVWAGVSVWGVSGIGHLLFVPSCVPLAFHEDETPFRSFQYNFVLCDCVSLCLRWGIGVSSPCVQLDVWDTSGVGALPGLGRLISGAMLCHSLL